MYLDELGRDDFQANGSLGMHTYTYVRYNRRTVNGTCCIPTVFAPKSDVAFMAYCEEISAGGSVVNHFQC